MKVFLLHWILVILFMGAGLLLTGCGSASRTQKSPPLAAAPLTETLTPDVNGSGRIIRELEERVSRDPEDFVALNKLAGYYLQHLRETGDHRFLELAKKSTQASLQTLPLEHNDGALSLLAQVEFASHNFLAAREHAVRLVAREPQKSYPYQILADVLLELGDYDGAAEAFQKLAQRGDQSISGWLRLSRFDLLRGQNQRAAQLLLKALSMARDEVPTQRETIAWCLWQLGELAFSQGEYAKAEEYYRESLTNFPNYYRAVASMGRVRAASGDLPGGIAYYEQVTKQLPDPSFVAALGDLYKLIGREREAATQYALVEKLGELNAKNGALYNRQLAVFFADHDLKTEFAFELAANEFKVRRDIYGADTLAWTALKAGKLDEARSAIKEALRLGTQDARLFYHAGMIARAAGNREMARNYLKRALALNPHFDPLQSQIAQRAVEE